VIRSILLSLWQGVDWDSINLSDIDWEEWIEPVLRSGEASEPFDWNNQELDNIKTLNMSSGTELTISSGAVTATQGHHSVDTEGNAATDDLDTINGLSSNDLLFLFAENGARTVRIRNGEGNIFLRHELFTKSFSFSSPAGSSGTFYRGGNYFAPAGEAVLTNVSPTVTLGSANISYAMHAFAVAKGDGATDGSDLVLTVTGASIDDEGNYNGSDSQVLVADALLATFATDTYGETPNKWTGQITITLSSTGGGTFNCSFNYGYAKYEDLMNQALSLTGLEVSGFAGANDTGFNIRLLYHSPTGWTYNASAFVPGGTVLANQNTDHSTDSELKNGEPINYKRTDLNQDVAGAGAEGLVIEITTTANKAVEFIDLHLHGHTVPNFLFQSEATQHALFMRHGSDLHQV
ncbi:hypothetical protein LCGC14_2809790, partial [marine sediment metagenome]